MDNTYKIINYIYPKYNNKAQLIDTLLSFLTDNPKVNDQLENYLFSTIKTNSKVDPFKVVYFIGLIHQKNKEKTKIAKTNERKHYGIYYTHYEIARLITNNTLEMATKNTNLTSLKLLEPCCGVGIFIFAFIDQVLLRLSKYTSKDIQKIIDNIYCADIDGKALDILKELMPLYIKSKYHIDITINNNNFYEGDLLFQTNQKSFKKNNPKEIFKISSGFDLVLTNPPYKLLKANANKYHENGKNSHSDNLKKLIEYIKQNKFYKYNEGTLNYYKLFIEEILESYTHDSSKIGLLIPITLLNDHQSKKLRKLIFNNYFVPKLYTIREKNSFFPDIAQAFCFFSLDKSTKGKDLELISEISSNDDFTNSGAKVSLETINAISEDTPIIIEKKTGWDILNKINPHPKIGSFSNICNLRGELDLSLDKTFITSQKRKFPLLRGSNLSNFSFSLGNLFVEDKFISKLNGKKPHITSERLACQQISNIHGNRRLKFSYIPPGIILGNSCNYICLSDSLFQNSNISLKYLMGLLNSLLLDWRFKATNSNNHISNYEISNLPIALSKNGQKEQLESLVDRIIKTQKPEDLAKLNIHVFDLYNLNRAETQYIINSFRDDPVIRATKQELAYAS